MKLDNHSEEKYQRFLYKSSKAEEEAENLVYKSVMGHIIYNAIPDEYIVKLEEFSKDEIMAHIGEIVESVLPFEEFDKKAKETQQFHLIFIRGYIHGGIAYHNNLIAEASDEDEVDDVPRKVEDVLDAIDYGDITDSITRTIKKEIDKDNKKLEEEEAEEEEIAEELEPEEEEDEDFEFEEMGDDLEVEEPEEGELDDMADDVEDAADVEEGEDIEEDIEDEEEGEEGVPEEEQAIGESTFEKIASSDPFGINVNKNENYIRLIKEKIIEGYADAGNENSDHAKLDVIIYISIAVAFHKLGIMSKAEFLRRLEEDEE